MSNRTRPILPLILITAFAACTDDGGPDQDLAKSRFAYAPTRLAVHVWKPPVDDRVALAPAERAVTLVLDNPSVFHIASAVKLQVVDVNTDYLAMTHVRLHQLEQGVPVVGGDLIVHIDAEGIVSLV